MVYINIDLVLTRLVDFVIHKNGLVLSVCSNHVIDLALFTTMRHACPTESAALNGPTEFNVPCLAQVILSISSLFRSVGRIII